MFMSASEEGEPLRDGPRKTPRPHSRPLDARLGFDLLSDIAVSPATEGVQLKAYHDAQRIMYADVPGFPLYSPFWVNATRARVSGYAPHPTEAEFWENIELSQ